METNLKPAIGERDIAIAIPEGSLGKYTVRHLTRPPGHIERTNARCYILGGQVHEPLHYRTATRWHELSYEGGVWMTDLPIERQQHMDQLIDVDEGSVLVAGLGLGYAAALLATRPDIHRIVVVEKSAEVIALVKPYINDPRGIIEVIHADIFDYLENKDEECEVFTHAFYDIWQSDSETTFFKTVVPLLRLTAKYERVSESIVCWNESVMRTQLASSLSCRGCLLLPGHENGPKLDDFCEEVNHEEMYWNWHWNWQVPFWRSFRDGVITDETFNDAARAYADNYGLEFFESWWGIVNCGHWDFVSVGGEA